MNLLDKIKDLMDKKQIKNIRQLSEMSNVPYSTIDSLFKKGYEGVRLSTMSKLCSTLGCSLDYLMSDNIEDTSSSEVHSIMLPDNILPIKKIKVPLLGSVACGKPIFAANELECYVESLDNIKCDFALTAKGDSMINARIFNGDLVFIKQQEMVANGEIAVILIDDEATLKRVFYDEKNSTLTLVAENPKYAPLVYTGNDLENVRILGKAVAFQSNIR